MKTITFLMGSLARIPTASRSTPLRIILGVSILMVLAGCQPPSRHPTNTIQPHTPTSSPSPTAPKTASATPVPKATTLTVDDAPAMMTPQNAAAVAQFARLGSGMVNGAPIYSMDGELLAIPTTLGVDLYQAATLHKLDTIPALSNGDLTLVPGYPRLVALSPDNHFLAANLREVNFSPGGNLQQESIQQSIYLWDVAEKTIVLKIPLGSEINLADLAFSPRGQSLAAGFDSGKVQLWNVTDGKELFSLKGSQLEFSPDGNLLATMPSPYSDDRHIYIYSAEDGHLLRQWGGQRAVFSPDGLIAVESAGAVRVMDIEKGAALQALNGKSAAFSSDGGSLALLDRDTIRLYRVSDGSLLSDMQGGFETVYKLQFAPDGQTLAIVGDVPMCPNCLTTPQAALWQVSAGTRTVLEIRDPLGITYAPHEGHLVIWAIASINILNPADASPIAVFDEYATSVNGIAFSPEGQILAANSGQPNLSTRLWQVAHSHLENRFEDPNNPGYGDSKALFSPDGRILWAQGRFWRTASGERLTPLENILAAEAPPYIPSSVSFSPDGQTMAIGYLEGHLQIWDLAAEKLVRKLEGFQGEVVDLAFSSDGKTLAAVYAYPDFTIQFWKMPLGERSLAINGVEWTHEFSQVVFSPDKQTLLSVAKNEDGMDLGVAELWRATDGKRLYQLDASGILSAAFSSDGQLIATGSNDHTVRLWQTVDGKLLKTLTGHADYVADLAFSPSGELLASGSNDGTVILWAVPGEP